MKEKLLEKINALRHELEEMVVNSNSLYSPDILKKSQELDIFLNEYERLLKEYKTNNK